MLFDYFTLAAVAQELHVSLVGAKLEKVTQPSALEIVLKLYHRGETYYLLLSADSAVARIHLTAVRRTGPIQPPGFCSALRKHLDGSWLEALDMPYGFGERIICLVLRAPDGARYQLVCEFMGRHSNLILTSASLRILGSAKMIRPSAEGRRAILPGEVYVAPNAVARPDGSRQVDPLGSYEPSSGPPLSKADALKWLRQTFAGVSSLAAEETICRAGTDRLTPDVLYASLRSFFMPIQDGLYSPRIWTDDRGVTLGAYPVELCTVKERNQHPRSSLNSALDIAAGSLIASASLENSRNQLLTAITRERRIRTNEDVEIEKGLVNAHRAGEYREAAELLLAARPAIADGHPFAEIPDYYAPLLPDGSVPKRRVPVDPAMGLQENVERYFRRSRKARESAGMLAARRDRIRDEIQRLSAAEHELLQAKDPGELEAVRQKIGSLLRQQAASPEKAKDAGHDALRGYKIRSFQSDQGWTILVGENAVANDYLTTRIAAPSDIWLHVRQATSAHGIIRSLNRPETVPLETLKRAAELVAARSEVKHSAIIPVDYTLKKYVRKPRKSAPGAVFYQNEKTIDVAGIHGDED